MCTCTSEWIGDYCELNASVAIQEVATGSNGDGMQVPCIDAREILLMCVLCAWCFLHGGQILTMCVVLPFAHMQSSHMT